MAKDHFLPLPNELFDAVLTHLDLQSIQRLRLTSTTYASKCLCPAFKRYYTHQVTDLTPSSLQRLLQITTHPVLGPSITNLTADAVFYDPSTIIRGLKVQPPLPPQDRAEHLLAGIQLLSWVLSKRSEQQNQFVDDVVASLARVLENLGSLASLRLRTRVVRDRALSKSSAAPGELNWNAMWADCHRLLRIVTLAMNSSKVRVETFSVFDQSFGKVQSRVFTELSTDLTSRGFPASAGGNIKNLNLSFSTATLVPGSDIIFNQDNSLDHRAARRLAAGSIATRTPEDFLGIAAFLAQTPQLERLDLHMYNTLEGAPAAYDRVFVHISKSVRLPRLRRLTLRGIWTTQAALLLFLHNHPDLTHLDLREVHITGGTWDAVLGHLPAMPKLAGLHLENLWSGRHLLNLEPADAVFDDGKRGPGHSYSTKNGTMVHTRDVTEGELRREGGLSFRTIPGRARGQGSRALMNWMVERARVYGPPR